MRRPALLVLGALAWSAAPAAAQPRPVDCELTVRGQTHIRGTCQFTPMQGGSFQISGGDYFAQVTLTGPGVAEGHWNADPASTHAQAPLGSLSRSGACWVGAAVRICARSLSPAAQRAAQAAQPDGEALFPEIALQACLGVEGALQPGAELVLHNCRVPTDLIFARRADGGLGISRRPDLCLGLEGPGMSKAPRLILEPCQPASTRWATQANGIAAAPVRSDTGMCLTIPQLEVAEARFPFAVEAAPCAAAGDRAVRFILSRG